MEWIFIVLVVGALGLTTAQLLDYVVESIRVRKAKRLDAAFSNELPSGDAPPPSNSRSRAVKPSIATESNEWKARHRAWKISWPTSAKMLSPGTEQMR